MFQGSIVAIVTPFTDQGEVDYPALKSLIDFQIDNGTTGIVPCGTTGESPTLSHDEHDKVISKTVEFVNKRVPVIAGAGSNNTSEAIRLSQAAQACGVDGILSVNPYYNKPSQEGLVKHFQTIADHVDVPIVLYNIPGRSAIALSIDTIGTLAQHKNIVAIKEATGDVDFGSQIRSQTDLIILSGDDALTLPLIAIGAKGVISVAANIVPRQMADLVQHALAGDYDKAREIHLELYPLFKGLFWQSNPAGVKFALGKAGYCRDDVRLPLCGMEDRYREPLTAILDNLNLIRG